MKRKAAVSAIALAVAAGAGFVYGVLTEHYKLFPRPQLQAVLDIVAPERKIRKPRNISLVFTDVEVSSFSIPGLTELGAIHAIGDRVLGTDRLGNFFLYWRDEHSSQNVKALNIEIDTGYERFVSDAAERNLVVDLSWYRIHDILMDTANGRLFASHHYWDSERACSTVRFVVAKVSTVDPMFLTVATSDWKILYETNPCIGFQPVGNPFEGLQAGAKMALRGPNELVVTVGDHGLDGWGGTEDHPQDPASSYGKLWSIDLAGGDIRMISMGHRNPEGLLIDHAGRIWITEHGPEGGDELNLIDEGGNYGWPHVTYGAQYGHQEWLRSSESEQGRHSGFKSATYVWLTSIGISQIIQLTGFVPAWEGDFLIGSLKQGSLYRVRYEDDRVTFVDAISLRTRIRDLDQLTDGTIIMWSDSAEILEMKPSIRQKIEFGHLDTLDASLRSVVLRTLEVCRQCHAVTPDSDSAQSPTLWGVYGRRIGDTDYPIYSNALRTRSGEWDRAALDEFLLDPKAYALGTTMAYSGIADENVRNQVINYLESLR